MFPINTAFDQADCRLRDTELLGKNHLSQIAVLDRPGFFFVDLGGAYAVTSDSSPALVLLSHVVSVGSQVQMGRLNTDGAIARVKNEQSASRAVVNAIGDDVSALSSAINSDLPVPLLVSSMRPVPAASIRRTSGHEPGEHFGVGLKMSGSSHASHHTTEGAR